MARLGGVMIEDYYLPTDALKKVLIGTMFLEEKADELIVEIIKTIIKSGHHKDAIKWGYSYGDGIVCIYKQIPVLDVENHLNSN